MPIDPIVETASTGGRRGPYRKTADTRSRILDAAAIVFGENGYEVGSVRRVAELAGMSQAGLLHHFPNKLALLSAVLERRDERAQELTAAGSGLGRLAAMIRYARDSAQHMWEIRLFVVLSAEATQPDHPAHEYMRRRYRWAIDVVHSALEEARELGQLQEWVDPAATASQFMALWDGLQIQWLLGGAEIDVASGLQSFVTLHLSRPFDGFTKH